MRIGDFDMLQTMLGIRALPLLRGLARNTATPARDGVWRRFFSSEGTQAMARYTHRQSVRPAPLLRAAGQRQGATRPTLDFAGLGQRTQRRGFRFSAWRRNANGEKPQEKLSLGARLKKLSKEYGWSAVGVYLALSVLDFPFCFLLVRVVGTDRIGMIEQYVVSAVKSWVPDSVRETVHGYWRAIKSVETEKLGDDGISEKVEMAGWGVEEANQRNKEEASLATQLALAYAIHKSFIFIRVPLTAAVTPKVVKVLRSWGWNIGKKRPSP
ncbi:peptide alpha-N-acetyltransferase [Purpureocillium lavendulum]|uniref:Peptide alpha-N-acetyltransferase n=1 Tax=Purpureocillium lavendulum TaxID=1247861 RepID=A0AB34FPX1_9HYPO|nr:peptide alpha-N-acetyltransferase [Purpureocillium lavendulum]